MLCQRSFWFLVPLTKQLLKRDKAGHVEVTINNTATVNTSYFKVNIESTGRCLKDACDILLSQIGHHTLDAES